ncbi:MAG: hypothetical protein ACKOQ4_12635 [Mycobacterium sp.]
MNLAASIDPITPWLTTLRTSLQNLVALPVLYLQQPLPILTTIARNQLTYLKELPDIGLIASQVRGNIETFFKGPYEPMPELISDALVTSIAGFPISQQTVYGFLLADASDEVDRLIEFAASPFSGELLGFAGTVISPLIQLTQSFTAIGTYFKDGDVTAALNELINIPANVTNAFLNGGKYLDLTAIAPKLGIDLPPQVTKIGLNMGGLLNVAPRAYEPPTLPGSDVHPYGGGVAFDSLAVELQQETLPLRDLDGSAATVSDPGWPTGAIAPVIGLGQALGDAMLVSNQLEVSGAAAAKTAEVPAPAVATAPAPEPAPAAEGPAAKTVSAPALKRAKVGTGKAARAALRARAARAAG